MIFRTNRNTRSLRRFTRPAFCYRIGDLPQIRSYFCFLPFTLVVIPLVASAYFHPGVLSTFKILEFVISFTKIFFCFLFFLFWFYCACFLCCLFRFWFC